MATTADMTLFQELFEKSPEIQYPKEGDVITGTIEKIEKKNILVNVNNQFTGLVISKELGNSVDFDALAAGQPIDVMVLGDSVEKTGLYALGYENNGFMLLSPMALIVVGLIIWVQRSRNKALIEEN